MTREVSTKYRGTEIPGRERQSLRSREKFREV